MNTRNSHNNWTKDRGLDRIERYLSRLSCYPVKIIRSRIRMPVCTERSGRDLSFCQKRRPDNRTHAKQKMATTLTQTLSQRERA